MHTFETFTLLQSMGFSISSDLIRYLLIAGGTYLALYYGSLQIEKSRIQKRKATRADVRYELSYSVQSIAMFSGVAVYIYFTRGTHFNQLYLKISDYGWGYFFLSLVLMTVIHDTYFYWMHRLMHHPKIYSLVHRVHHRSVNPTPFAANSFHATEAVLESLVMPLMIAVMPISIWAIVVFDLFSFSTNVIGHLGYEFAPRWWVRNPVTKWLMTSTFHNIHHSRFGTNYGFYFTFWDRMMGTLDPHYERDFDRIHGTKSDYVFPEPRNKLHRRW